MKYLEINEASNYILTDETACLNVYKIHRLSDIAISDVTSNQIAKVRRLTFQKERNDSVVMYAYIGDGYIEYLTNTMMISWGKARNGDWKMSGNSLCLFLGAGGKDDAENILVLECVYGIVEGTRDSFGFEIFDDYGKLIFALNNNLVRVEAINDLNSGVRPYNKEVDYADSITFEKSVNEERLLLVQESFSHISSPYYNNANEKIYYAIKQSRNKCELSKVKEGQNYYSGVSYGFGLETLYTQMNVYSIANSCLEMQMMNNS